MLSKIRHLSTVQNRKVAFKQMVLLHNMENHDKHSILRQDGLAKNLPIPPMLYIWSLPDVPELVILAVFMSIEVKKSGEYFGIIKS